MTRKPRSKQEVSLPAAETSPGQLAAIAAGLVALILLVFAQVRDHEFVSLGAPDPQLFGMNAGTQHLLSVALHACNAIFLFLLLHRMTSRVWRSAIVAAVFAIHPLHVESVAWLSQRKDLLGTAFLLITMWLYVSWTRTASRIAYALLLVAFLLGLLSHAPMLIALPFVLLLLDRWPLGRAPNVREKIPLFVMAAIALFFALRTPKLSLASYAAYLRKAVWPNDLVTPYAVTEVSIPAVIVSVAILLGISVLVVLRSQPRYLATGWFWFVISIVPVSIFGPYVMADHYMYVPLIGLTIAVVWLVADAAARHVEIRIAAIALTAFAIVGFTAAAYAQTRHWRSSVALFLHTLSREPMNAYAELSLGQELLNAGGAPAALPHFQRAAALWPSNAQAHYGLGMALAATGRNEEAARALRRSLELNPKNDAAMFELGRLELTSGRTAEAAELLAKASSAAPTPLSRGSLALAQNNLQEALKQFEAAVKADPKSAEAHNNLGATLARLGRDVEAVQHYEEAIRLAPDHYDAMMNLGALLSRMGRNSEAGENFEKAARARPNTTEPLVYSALASAISGNTAAALEAARRAHAMDARVANQQFTNATHMAPKETNLQEFISQLEAVK